MRVIVATILLLAVCGSVSAQSVLAKLERTTLFGREYVRLDDWADGAKFGCKWLRRDEELQLTNRATKLLFTADSNKAEVNGVTVTLSFPVARRNGTIYITPLDLQTSIYPILFPPRNSNDASIVTICLDPGHGGKDPGNLDGKKQEKKYSLLIAEEVQKQLKAAGFKVLMTRTSDKFVELTDRINYANERSADLFISLHLNSVESGGARGIETYCLTPAHTSSSNARGEGASTGSLPGNLLNDKNLTLAYQLQKSLVKGVYAEDRGVKRARFAIFRTAQMPAVLVECGYMSDPNEAQKIYDSAYRKKLARAIVDGVTAYKKIVERQT